MLLFTRPTDERIQAFLANQKDRQYSYDEVGASRGRLPSGYRVLHGRAELGHGSAQFVQASEALNQWKMFDVPGVRLCWPTTPIRVGSLVAVLIKHFGIWSLNFCRIVYVLDEEGPVRRLGFAYGTLAEHAERGEERFTVEWDRSSDLVSYDILSFSRPGNWKTLIAYPAARRLQQHFVDNSLIAMVRAVRQERTTDPESSSPNRAKKADGV
jgi:uncharacterized protein (UPF0548 family)